MVKKKIRGIYFFLLITLLNTVFAQDTLSNLLPDKMIFTQRMLWGENGLMRKTKLVPLNRENRYSELNVRNGLFMGHRILGYVTAAELLGSTIVGWQLFNGKNELKGLHEGLTTASNITYFTGLTIALFAPPPKENGRGWSIVAHKILSTIHIAGMITTDILGNQIETNSNMKKAHKISAITTFASYEIAAIIIHF